MREIPEALLDRPFHRDEALALGVSARVLEGVRFVRVHPRVYRRREHVMTFADDVLAARLALPGDAHVTGITRLQLAGLPKGATRPLRFVVQRDHHLALEGIFLHRTVLLPPLDEVGVTPAAAYLAYCHQAVTLDAIGVGEWLLNGRHLSAHELGLLASTDEWRDGAAEVAWVLQHLSGGARSLPESTVRSMLRFAGLPPPEPNAVVELGDTSVHADLWFPAQRLVVECEGVHHQTDRGQYLSDIDRYALYRRYGVRYLQVTRERTRAPKAVVRDIHRELVAAGYVGPPPDFGATWESLFAPLRRVVPQPRRGAVRRR